jgi:CRP-like cAMP-binding protein
MDDVEGEEELHDKIILGPGDCVGETGLFINHAHALTAIAVEEGEVLCLNACKIPDICSGTPHVAQCLSDLLQLNLRHIKLEA